MSKPIFEHFKDLLNKTPNFEALSIGDYNKLIDAQKSRDGKTTTWAVRMKDFARAFFGRKSMVYLKRIAPNQYGIFAREDLKVGQVIRYCTSFNNVSSGAHPDSCTPVETHPTFLATRGLDIDDSVTLDGAYYFFNHLCDDYNCNWRRKKQTDKFQYEVVTRVPVKAHAELTINYGNEYFQGDHFCWCDKYRCKKRLENSKK